MAARRSYNAGVKRIDRVLRDFGAQTVHGRLINDARSLATPRSRAAAWLARRLKMTRRALAAVRRGQETLTGEQIVALEDLKCRRAGKTPVYVVAR